MPKAASAPAPTVSGGSGERSPPPTPAPIAFSPSPEGPTRVQATPSPAPPPPQQPQPQPQPLPRNVSSLPPPTYASAVSTPDRRSIVEFTPTHVRAPFSSNTTPQGGGDAAHGTSGSAAGGESTSSADASSKKKFRYNPTAVSFSPNKGMAAALPPLPPSILELPPAIPPLQSHWSLWATLHTSDGFAPARLHTVGDVREFWYLMNNIRTSVSQDDPSFARLSLYLFRDAVEPKWEDPANINGGCWQIVVSSSSYRETIDDRFRALCSWVVSEPQLQLPSDSVVGVGIKIREKYTVEIWLSRSPAPDHPPGAFVDFVSEACKVLGMRNVRADFYVQANRIQSAHAPPTIQHQVF